MDYDRTGIYVSAVGPRRFLQQSNGQSLVQYFVQKMRVFTFNKYFVNYAQKKTKASVLSQADMDFVCVLRDVGYRDGEI